MGETTPSLGIRILDERRAQIAGWASEQIVGSLSHKVLSAEIASLESAIAILRDYERWRPMIEQAGKMDKVGDMATLAVMETESGVSRDPLNAMRMSVEEIRALLASIPQEKT